MRKNNTTWEKRVYGSIPWRYLAIARTEVMKRCGISESTFKKYLKGRYPNPAMRDYFRRVLFETYKQYRDLAAEEVLIELD